jgi:hypothetical protein
VNRSTPRGNPFLVGAPRDQIPDIPTAVARFREAMETPTFLVESGHSPLRDPSNASSVRFRPKADIRQSGRAPFRDDSIDQKGRYEE